MWFLCTFRIAFKFLCSFENYYFMRYLCAPRIFWHMGACFMYFDCNISAIYRIFQFISMEHNLHMRDSNPSCQMQTCFQDVYASVNSKHQHPPRADPRGNFLKWWKPCHGAKFFCKSTAPGTRKYLPPGEYCERSSQLFLLVGVEILEFCRNHTLKRTGRLFKSYPFVSV